ncbi:MAG: hypothetical protein ABIO17_07545 [Pseudoxanthomonas sp.]
MSQKDFLRDFDAAAVACFHSAGIADTATYRATVADLPVACVVLVDRNVRDYGDDLAPVAVPKTLVLFQLAQVSPKRGGLVLVHGEEFALDAEVRRDESVSQWVVANA